SGPLDQDGAQARGGELTRRGGSRGSGAHHCDVEVQVESALRFVPSKYTKPLAMRARGPCSHVRSTSARPGVECRVRTDYPSACRGRSRPATIAAGCGGKGVV